MIDYERETNSYNFVMREDGVVDDTSEQASDWTNGRDATTILLRSSQMPRAYQREAGPCPVMPLSEPSWTTTHQRRKLAPDT